MKRRTFALGWLAAGAAVGAPRSDPRLKGAFRRPAKKGWIFVHLAGTPREIEDGFRVISANLTNDTKKHWGFFRETARKVRWPRAFVAAGSSTRNGRIVIGHNAWNIGFDIMPAKGYRIFMDGYPGCIHGADGSGMNSAGILIAETTITGFGGYANNWPVAGRISSEIASLELGIENVELRRTGDGYFSGANFPVNEKLLREKASFRPADAGVGANARRVRWDRPLAEFRGEIDIKAGRQLPCGHVDFSPPRVGRMVAAIRDRWGRCGASAAPSRIPPRPPLHPRSAVAAPGRFRGRALIPCPL